MTGGWTCPTCRAWTPNGTAHDCPGVYGRVGAPRLDPSFLQLDALSRIACALERIAVQFEKGSGELDVMKDRGGFDDKGGLSSRPRHTGLRYPE